MALVILCVLPVVLAVVWRVAYRIGFSEGRLTLPLRLVHAIAEHQVACRGEEPERVVRELVRVLALPERESRRLISSKLRSLSSSRGRALRSA